MNHETLCYFKSVKDFLVFTLLYTEGKTRDTLLGLDEVSDIHTWYNETQEKLFPIENGLVLSALTNLSTLYDKLKVEANKLIETPDYIKPKKNKKDTFIILESGINFSNDNLYLCEKIYVAFPTNSNRLKTIRQYCVSKHDKRFYCIGPRCKEAKGFSFKDVENETGYIPAIGTDRASAGINYLKVNKLVEEI